MNENNLMSTLAEIQQARAELELRAQAVKAEAVSYVQEIINTFGIQARELSFGDAPAVEVVNVKPRKPRAPAVVKYRLPNGVEWTGKGLMKSAFKQYLEEHNLTRADLDQFLTDEYKNNSL